MVEEEVKQEGDSGWDATEEAKIRKW